MAKKRGKKTKKTRELSIQFMPYSEIRHLDSTERIKKILSRVLDNEIIILQGRLNPEEESRLIGDTMALIGHIKNFKGIELAVISENGKNGILGRLRSNIARFLLRGEMGAVTIIGPATIVKEIKRDPKKIELLLNK